MSRIFTDAEIKRLGARATRSFSKGLEARNIFESKQSNRFDVFISYNYSDTDTIRALYDHLTDMGLSVYVDFIVDKHLPRHNVTKKTAEIIQDRLKNSKSLLYVLSSNSQMSKWMPWELGYVDGHTSKCAIMPISQSEYNRNFVRQEFLTLYPTVESDSNLEFEINTGNYYNKSIINWIKG